MGAGILGIAKKNVGRESYPIYSMNQTLFFIMWWFYWSTILKRKGRVEGQTHMVQCSSVGCFCILVVITQCSSMQKRGRDDNVAKARMYSTLKPCDLTRISAEINLSSGPQPQSAVSFPVAAFAVRSWLGGLLRQFFLRWPGFPQ